MSKELFNNLIDLAASDIQAWCKATIDHRVTVSTINI